MRKLRVLCDADDCLENLVLPWTEAINHKFGANVKWKDITEWDMSKFFPSLAKEQVYSPIYEDGFWDSVQPMPWATSFINQILDDGHELYIVTATNYQTCGAKITKLLELFPMLKWENFIITSNKQMVRGDVLIDDCPQNLIDGLYYKVLFNRPHNQNFNEKEYGIKRVCTLRGAYWEVRKLAER